MRREGEIEDAFKATASRELSLSTTLAVGVLAGVLISVLCVRSMSLNAGARDYTVAVAVGSFLGAFVGLGRFFKSNRVKEARAAWKNPPPTAEQLLAENRKARRARRSRSSSAG
jgi:hypothetical protein